MTTPARSVLVISHVAVVWGAQRRLLDLAPRLVDHGFQLTLASPPGDLAESWRGLGLPAHDLELPEHAGVHPSQAAVLARSVPQIMRQAHPYDVLQSHSLYAHLETTIAGRLARRPTVIDVHDIVSPGAGRKLLHLASRLATVTVANSNATAEMVGGPQARGVVVVNPGVDLARFAPRPADPDVRCALTAHPDEPLVGILGRVDPRKGIDTLVEAMGVLRARDMEACLAVVGAPFVGDAAWVTELQARAHGLLGDRVRFVGPRDDPERVVRALDVLVNASHHEPFGRTILEAQASGIPVLGTASGGVPEFVSDGETGVLVPPRDVASMAGALERLLTDHLLRARVAAGGRAQAVARFGLDAQAAKVAATYRLALGEARCSS